MTDDYSNPNCPIKIAHGTTTLAFRFKGGIIVATDSRATAGNWIASQTVKKVIEINNCLLGTMAGGAAVSAGILYAEGEESADFRIGLPILAGIPGHAMSSPRAATQAPHLRRRSLQDARQPRLLVQGHGPVHGTFTHHTPSPFHKLNRMQGTMCAGVTPQEGPALYYIDSDGTRLAGNLFCVGSGQTFAYGVLDAQYKYDLSDEDALELGRRSILAATHRDAYSGGFINLYHVKEDGWVKHGFSDTNPIFWKTKLEKGEFSNVTAEME